MAASTVTGVGHGGSCKCKLCTASRSKAPNPGINDAGMIIITEADLRRLLQQAFDEGWSGYKEARDDVAETLIFGYLVMRQAEEVERLRREAEEKKRKEEEKQKIKPQKTISDTSDWGKWSYGYSYDRNYY